MSNGNTRELEIGLTSALISSVAALGPMLMRVAFAVFLAALGTWVSKVVGSYMDHWQQDHDALEKQARHAREALRAATEAEREISKRMKVRTRSRDDMKAVRPEGK